jgi:regulator of cell morphogenesis and NO signaling
MELVKENVIGVLVAQDYRTASVFKKYNIDFCCQGSRTINDACESQSINSQTVLDDLNAVVNKSSGGESIDYKTWSLDLLADYIEKTHHRYVEEKILEIKPYLAKICSVHGDRHPELFEVNELFIAGAGELVKHMKKEEFILFPYVRKIVVVERSKEEMEQAPFGTVQNPIQMMMDEHEIEGERFRKISELTNNYTAPDDACGTYRVTFGLLREFEEDLHLHIHLENNILFPNAIKLEQKLSSVLVN